MTVAEGGGTAWYTYTTLAFSWGWLITIISISHTQSLSIPINTITAGSQT